MQKGVELALVLRKIRGVRVRAVHCGGALVDGREACCTDLEFSELVIVDLDSISRVAVTGSNDLTSLAIILSTS